MDKEKAAELLCDECTPEFIRKMIKPEIFIEAVKGLHPEWETEKFFKQL